MANINEEARIPVYINDEQAKSALKNLTAEAEKWRKTMQQAMAGNDMKGMKEAQRELAKVNKEMGSLKKASFDVDKVLNDLSSAAPKDVRKALRELTIETEKLNRGTKESVENYKKLKILSAELRSINAETRATNQGFSFGSIADGFNKYFAVVTAGIASLTGLALGFKTVVQSFNDFQERVSNLSALTGLKGEALGWLTEKAKELSTTVLDGGIRITKSAIDIVDGFTKMGSARPELLKNKEALAQVTEKALILAQASKIEMAPAIDAVAASMNQFNLDASQSDRIINALAAGSLEGSSEVGDLTESLKNVGTVAADSNMSLEQTVSALEVLAEKQLKGVEGGTKLRGALLKMKDAGVGYASGSFVLRDALIEINSQLERKTKAVDKDALKQKVFGIENITAGNILLQNVEKYDKLTKAVTNTSVAYEQAAINSDNNNAKLLQAQNKINLKSIELGEKLAPAMASITGWYGKLLTALIVTVNFLTKYGVVILSVTATIATYVAVLKVAAYWDAITSGLLKVKTALTVAYRTVVDVLTGRITLATIAQNAWNLAQKLNPIGLLLSLLVAVGAALYIYTRKLTDAELAQKALNDIKIKAKEAMSDEKVEMEQLLRIAQNELLSKEQRQRAIKKLNDISPQYLGGLTLETINTRAAKLATDQYIASLIRKAELEAAMENLKESQKRIGDLKAGKGEEAGVGQTLSKWLITGSTKGYKNLQADATKENQQAALKEEEARSKIIQGRIDEIVRGNQSLLPDGSSGSGGSGGNGGAVGLTDEEIKLAAKKASDALELAHNQRVLQITARYLYEETLQKEFHAKMLAEEATYLNAKFVLEQDPAKKIDLATQFIKKMKEYTDAVKDSSPIALKLRGGQIDPGLSNDLAGQPSPTDKQRADATEAYRLKKYYETLEGETALVKSQYASGLIGEQEFQDKLVEIQNKAVDKKLKKQIDGARKFQQITEEAANLVSALMESELQDAGDNEEKKKEIKKKYADAQMVVTIGQIISSTALAIMQSFAQLGPIAGAIAAAFIGATGVV